jgi:hypothetical protein
MFRRTPSAALLSMASQPPAEYNTNAAQFLRVQCDRADSTSHSGTKSAQSR